MLAAKLTQWQMKKSSFQGEYSFVGPNNIFEQPPSNIEK